VEHRDGETYGFATFRTEYARIKSSGCCRLAGLTEVSSGDIVLATQKVELQVVTHSRRDGVGSEGEALAYVDSDRGSGGLRDRHSN